MSIYSGGIATIVRKAAFNELKEIFQTAKLNSACLTASSNKLKTAPDPAKYGFGVHLY